MVKIVIFTQNTMASIVATREVLKKNNPEIKAIVLSSQLRGESFIDQAKVAYKLIKKSSAGFFLYKIVESKLYNLLLFYHKSVKSESYKSGQATTIQDLAKIYNIPVIETSDLSNDNFLQKIKDINPDFVLCLVAQILKKNVFEVLRNKLINAHGSYLPKYRGPAQYFWYLLNEDTQFGVTIHYMEKGLDTGDVIMQKEFDYYQTMTAYKLHYELAKTFGLMFNNFINEHDSVEDVKSEKQDDEKATFTRMPTSEDMKDFKQKGKKLLSLKDFLNCV